MRRDNVSDIKIPARYKFVLARNTETGEQYVLASEVKNKVKLENVKYNALRSISLQPNVRFAVLDVRDINTREELINHLNSLSEVWKVEEGQAS